MIMDRFFREGYAQAMIYKDHQSASFISSLFILISCFQRKRKTVQLSKFRNAEYLFHKSFNINYSWWHFPYVRYPAVMQPHTY